MAAPEHQMSRVLEAEPPPGVVIREGTYGTQVVAVEPGGAEFIPLNERHGKPLQLFWTWTSPNMEFATIFVGVLAVAVFGLGFWAALLAIVLGTAIGGVTQGSLSCAGPRYGVPQMVLSRLGFGYWGNALPAGLNSVTAGIGWFAVNSVSGAFALNVLTHLPQVLCLLIIVAVQVVVAFFGYNLVHVVRAVRVPGADRHLPDRGRGHPEQGPPRRAAHGSDSRRLPADVGRGVRLRGRAGTRTRPTTPATSSRTRTRRPSPGGPGSGCSCPAPCSRSSARRRPP